MTVSDNGKMTAVFNLHTPSTWLKAFEGEQPKTNLSSVRTIVKEETKKKKCNGTVFCINQIAWERMDIVYNFSIRGYSCACETFHYWAGSDRRRRCLARPITGTRIALSPRAEDLPTRTGEWVPQDRVHTLSRLRSQLRLYLTPSPQQRRRGLEYNSGSKLKIGSSSSVKRKNLFPHKNHADAWMGTTRFVICVFPCIYSDT